LSLFVNSSFNFQQQ